MKYHPTLQSVNVVSEKKLNCFRNFCNTYVAISLQIHTM